eukprot:TRINITY_DN873_c0_g2_i2.p1 TRINITY_DN873_c0_g2~~TRINITY_DN873_c0_g2_i2.p1  ORF type:complete len:234 (+),score=29.26 TRINITY_DN873_c0_g2_i2:86-787(+)
MVFRIFPKKAMELPFLELLKKLYPHQIWKPELLLNVPTSTWQDAEKTRDFLEALEPELFITKKTDWYHVSKKQLLCVGGGSCLLHFNYRMLHMLQFAFPEISWDSTKFSNRAKKASQRWLLRRVTEIFAGKQILYDYRHNFLSIPEDSLFRKKIEFDIWLPEIRLAIEYQGEHHYRNFTKFIGGTSIDASKQQMRDASKRNLCAREGIDLVEVPFWWDGHKETLIEILEEQKK